MFLSALGSLDQQRCVCGKVGDVAEQVNSKAAKTAELQNESTKKISHWRATRRGCGRNSRFRRASDPIILGGDAAVGPRR